MLLVNAWLKHEQKKTGKLREQIVNDLLTGKNSKMRQNRVLMPYFQVAERRSKNIVIFALVKIRGSLQVLYSNYVSILFCLDVRYMVEIVEE